MANHVLFDRDLPQGWTVTTVDAIKADEKSACVAGPFGSNISSKYFVPEGVPVIRGGNLTDDLTRFVPSNFVFVSPERAASYRAQHVRAGDLIFTCWGTIGQVGLIPDQGPFQEYIISNKQLKFRPNTSVADPEYLFYYFASPEMVAHIRNRAIGAAVPGINLGILKALEVVLPPLPTQRRIAAILSAYDDLIENNTRRIAILEEMARRIYEEWFVRFRFPGHEGVRMVDHELGAVPEGWEIAPVDGVMDTLGGGTPSKTVSEYWDEGKINWYSPTDLTGAKTAFMESSASKITPLGLAKSSAKIFPPYSVMMTSRATLGVIAVNTTEACTNQGFITCVPSTRMPVWLLFHWLKANAAVFESMATGATFKEITKGVFRKIELVIPPSDLVASFEKTVGPMMELVLRLERKNENLRTTRDLLLPKLISGELDVSKLPEPEEVAA